MPVEEKKLVNPGVYVKQGEYYANKSSGFSY